MAMSDEIAALDEGAKRLRLYMAVLAAVAEGRQALSRDAAGRIRGEIARLSAERDALAEALRDFVSMGEQYEWDKAMTGRSILMRNARDALARLAP